VLAEDTRFAEAFPTWRGRLHTWAFFASVPAGAVLVVAASGVKATVATLIYALSLAALFGVSASYHRLARSPRVRNVMRRLDHAFIYVLIAGTYTPICLLALPPAWGLPVLVIVWTGAVIGIVLKAFQIRSLLSVANALYIVLGWTAVVALPVVAVSVPPVGLVFLVIGGLAYTAGAIVLLRRRPNPRPAVFGFHEVWHLCTLVGAVSHYVTVWLIAV